MIPRRRIIPWFLYVSLAASSMSACGGPTHDCEIRGRVLADDNRVGGSCSLDMYVGTRKDRLTHMPISTGYDFRVAINLPVLDPTARWHGVVRCPGYEEQATREFDLGVGWGTCQAVQLDTITVTHRPD